MKLKLYFAPLFFIVAVAAYGMFLKTGDLWWTLGASAFAVASIYESIRLILDIIEAAKRQ